MAFLPMQGAQNVPMDDAAEQLLIQRRMKVADALRQQSSQELQPTMVGSQLVAPNPLQHIARALAGWQANRADADVMGEANRYADSKRQRIAQAMAGLKNADSPEAMMATGAQLMSVPGAEQMGQNLYMAGAQQARSAHLMDKFFPQSGQPAAQGTQAPMPQGQPLGSVDLSGGQPSAAATPMAPQASAPQSGFDERRYLAMLATGDPTLAKAAEEYKARTMIPAANAAQLDFDRFKFGNMSAAQKAEQDAKDRELKVTLARLGIDVSKLDLERAKAGYEFGYGGATPGVMPGQPNAAPAPAGPAASAPTAAPAAPAAPPAPTPGGRPVPPKVADEITADRAKKENELAVKRQEQAGKAFASLTKYRDQNQVVSDAIDRALGRVSKWSAGSGSLLKNMPATEARALADELQTIKANAGYRELSDMRANSPTGGALGNVTERETDFLQALPGTIDQATDPQNLIAQLKRAKEGLGTSYGRLLDAYKMDFPDTTGGLDPQWGKNQATDKASGVVDWNSLHGR